MTTITATEARKNFYRLLDDAQESHEPIHITSKRGNAVLVCEQDWQSIQETLYLLSIPDMRDAIITGIKTPIAKCSKNLRW